MEDEINITVQIFPKEKEIYIAEESSSGASYNFNNIQELHFYLENYYKEAIEGTKEEIDRWTILILIKYLKKY